LRARLGAARCDALWALGAGLSLAEAAALAAHAPA
jgi:hypothetical protein